MTPPITAVVGGSVGSDPWAPNTWSGSASAFFTALKADGLLDQALGVEISRPEKATLMALNFARDRSIWRRHFYFDPRYRRALTRAAGKLPIGSAVALQLGHMFSLPDVFPQVPCVSYHDGNLSETVRSGFGMTGVSARRIEQALRYEEETSQKVAAIFTFSEYLRQSFIHDYRVSPEKVVNIGSGVNLQAPPADPAKDYSAPRLLFVGVDFRRKGGPQLLEAFQAVRQSIPAAELHIVGPREQPATLPAGVLWHGHLSKAEPAQAAQLDALFRQATLFVLPSLYEPFGIAPIEALLYQVPAVVTDAWALRETIQPGVNGALVAKGSVEDLTSTIVHLLSDPAKLAEMGLHGRERALVDYTWPRVAQRIRVALGTLGLA